MAADDVAPLMADIYLLTVVSQTRSFTQAARRMGVSKASVSMRIAALEKAAGVPLVQRTTRAVQLTDAGQALVSNSESAFERIGSEFASVKDLSGAPRGTVRVTAPVALGRQHVAPTLAAFLRRYPEIVVHLALTDRFVNLQNEGFDLAIRHTSVAPDSYVAWSLCSTRSILMASPAYLRRRGVPMHPRDLAAHDCLLYLGDSGTDTWSFVPVNSTDDADAVSVPVRGALKANNSEVLRQAAIDGLGIGLLPDFSTAASPRHRLRPVLTDWRVRGFFGDQLYALRPWAPRVPRAVQCFVDHLRESFSGGFGMAGTAGAGAAKPPDADSQ